MADDTISIRYLAEFFEKEAVPQLVEQLLRELVPLSPSPLDRCFREEQVAAAVFEKTGLAPSEYRQLDDVGKYYWLQKALGLRLHNETGEQEYEAPPPDDDESLLERVLASRDITANGAAIFEAIWRSRGRTMRFDSIANIQGGFTSTPASDSAIEKALKTLRTGLAKANLKLDLVVSNAKGRATIEDRRQKQGKK